MSKKFDWSKLWKETLAWFKTSFLSWAKKWLLDLIVKKVIGGAIGGVWGWVFNLSYKILWKKYIGPSLNAAWNKVTRKIELAPNKKENADNVEGYENATTTDDQRTNIDNLL